MEWLFYYCLPQLVVLSLANNSGHTAQMLMVVVKCCVHHMVGVLWTQQAQSSASAYEGTRATPAGWNYDISDLVEGLAECAPPGTRVTVISPTAPEGMPLKRAGGEGVTIQSSNAEHPVESPATLRCFFEHIAENPSSIKVRQREPELPEPVFPGAWGPGAAHFAHLPPQHDG